MYQVVENRIFLCLNFSSLQQPTYTFQVIARFKTFMDLKVLQNQISHAELWPITVPKHTHINTL